MTNNIPLQHIIILARVVGGVTTNTLIGLDTEGQVWVRNSEQKIWNKDDATFNTN